MSPSSCVVSTSSSRQSGMRKANDKVLDSSCTTVATDISGCVDLMGRLTIREKDENSNSSSDEHDENNNAGSSSAPQSTPSSSAATAAASPPPHNINNSKSLKKSVSFHQVEVREYARTIGDHPDVVLGPPVTIDWDHSHQESQHIDDYESNRVEKRSKIQLRMHPNTRNRMMLEAGISKEEIKAATKSANKVQKQRKNTVAFLEVPIVGVLEEATQSAGRKIRRRSWRSRSSSGDLDVTAAAAAAPAAQSAAADEEEDA